ncbi:PQQ-like beta-propeller repeat protein [Solirubrobacter taibaiensis]|nr:PQQ-like beta-propeller repeat protein [Solirubrobacter taibaiensis]
MRRVLMLVLTVLVLAPPAARAQQPLGVVDHTLARFDRDTLQPVGPVIEAGETHSMPVMAPGGGRFALGVSSSGEPGIPETGRGRVGLWVVDAGAMRIERQIRTGIAAESVVFPGKVAAVLQDGALVVVDPQNGRIVSRRQVGFSFGTPQGVHASGRGVIVNEIRRGRGVEVVVVSASGAVRTAFARMPGVERIVGLASDGTRAYIVGNRRIAVLDPRTMRVRTRRFDGNARSAVVAGGSLAVAGPGGLRMYDVANWRLLARDNRSAFVYASGNTVVASGEGRITTRDSASGRVLWRASGSVGAVAAGRVYAQPAVLDAATGARVGTHPVPNTLLRLL